MNIKDVNKVIDKYEQMLSQANRQLVLLSVMVDEQQEEIQQLTSKIHELESK
jgi:uncharacterized protein YqgV (UPF0045/DUF77 family)